MVFGETWENGTASWRTQRNNGSDCKGWPTCPFDAATMPGAPPQMLANTIFVKNGDGDGGRDNGTCSGKYVHIPRSYAGYDAGNLNVVGGVTQGAVYRNAQFVANGGDRMCVVAWVRAFPEANPFAGPMVGINYTGSHGVVDAGHNHGTHWMIGAPRHRSRELWQLAAHSTDVLRTADAADPRRKVAPVHGEIHDQPERAERLTAV